jgi:hypothetical protein
LSARASDPFNQRSPVMSRGRLSNSTHHDCRLFVMANQMAEHVTSTTRNSVPEVCGDMPTIDQVNQHTATP